jgi:hypothetical protein
MSLLSVALPSWSKWLALALAAASIFLLGQIRGERIAGEKHLEYVAKQAAQTVKIAQAQTKVVIQKEVEYRDRIQKIYIKGETIEKEVPVYVTQADNANCTVNAGFVRVHDAAWSSEPPGPPAEPDRQPSGIPLAEVAEANAFNATACLAWREQALGLRDFYKQLQAVTNSSEHDAK